MKRTKYIPAIVTLVGCLAASIIAIVNRYDALHSMIIISDDNYNKYGDGCIQAEDKTIHDFFLFSANYSSVILFLPRRR